MGYKALQHLDNADWLVGFTEGDGSFFVSITKSQIRICITQNHLDRSLLLAIKDWFNCGHLYPSRKDNTINYTVQKRSDLTNMLRLRAAQAHRSIFRETPLTYGPKRFFSVQVYF